MEELRELARGEADKEVFGGGARVTEKEGRNAEGEKEDKRKEEESVEEKKT